MADDTLTVVGVLEAVTERNGWTQFEVNVGRQYPVRLSTKKDTVIASGRAMGSSDAVWSYKESQGGANPHKPGEFYTNRYLESAVLATDENRGTAQASTAHVTQTFGRSSDDSTRRSIERSTIIKAALPLLGSLRSPGLLSITEEADFFDFCERAYTWVSDPGQNDSSVASGATESAAEGSGDHEQPPPHDDGDVPY